MFCSTPSLIVPNLLWGETVTHGVRFKSGILSSQVLIGEGLVSCIYPDLDKEYYANHATLEFKLKLNPSIQMLVKHPDLVLVTNQ